MPTVTDALREMHLDADEGERCIATIDARGKYAQYRARTVDADLDDFEGESLYTTVARYAHGSLQGDKGRTAENCCAVDALIFDADLKDYLTMSQEELHEKDHEELDAYTASLQQDAKNTFDRLGIPVHQIISTGYGIALHVRLHPDDQGRVEDADLLQKSLVERINGWAGGCLVDPAVNDPRTRLTRVVGSFNYKGKHPRPVRCLWDAAGNIRIDAYPCDPPPVRMPTHRPEERELDPTTVDEIVRALDAEYGEGNRNAIALGVAAMLAKAGVPEHQAETIISCVARDDEELHNRLDAVRRTYEKWEKGASIAGYHKLGDFIRPSVRDYVSSRLAPPRVPVIVPTHEEPEEEDTLFHETFGAMYPAPPAECYYGWYGDFVRLFQHCTSGPDQYLLSSAHVYGGATSGRHLHTYHAGRLIYPNLMAVLIGDSGTSRKDTCIGYARDLFAMQANKNDVGMPVLPYSQLNMLSTAEGLVEHLNSSDPKARCVIYVREFNALLLKARRDSGGGVLPMLQDLWDSYDQVNVPTRKDPLRVDNPTVSLIGSVTPTVLARDANVYDIEGGFANRLLWIYGSGKAFIPDPPEPDYGERRRLISEFMRAFQSFGTEPLRISKNAAASLWWDEWSMANHNRRFLNEDEVNLSARLQNNALRIALNYAISDGSRVITEPQLRAATSFVDWQYDQIKREVRLWGSDDNVRLQTRILNTLRMRPFGRKELFEQLARYSVSTVKKALEDLQWMETVKLNQDGRYALA